MQQKTLLSNALLKRFTPTSSNFPLCEMKYTQIVEEDVMNECFGDAFYEDMLSKLADYSNLEKYNLTTTYIVGDVVSFEGSIYIAIQPNTNIPPPNNLNWKAAPIFDPALDINACFEYLFCTYLAQWIALNMYNTQIAISANTNTGNGNLTWNSGNYETATRQEVEMQANAIIQLRVTLFKNMDRFIKKNKDCYPLYPAFIDTCCQTCKQKDCKGGCVDNQLSMHQRNRFY